MDREHARQLLPILQAYAEGKTIQWRDYGNEWADMVNPDFRFPVETYRVKPEPREWWVNVYPNGLRQIHNTREQARVNLDLAGEIVHVREVLE